ncbi:hypothetical protein TraAM80_07199 [Trypanosoma rangeli]|uniref:Centrosomal protein POC5 n=1 Tax=Trypanosoma rangeli TaxID=5698 RepID=A0A422N6R7_TRYRA|nr:uncharacterized protein TraAM80_07199 [Trypanosoma rangeli]RNF01149.1 hypothetical protein TraAM80_07199 [Trypanosoma rangeli]|eukprot:RNF01149.1 hypothetical protein TraAM80_07199 [Trypanosoma rangeli]
MMEGVTEAGDGGGGVALRDFLQQVGNGIDTHTTRLREDILLLLLPYLKEHLLVMKESLRAEAEHREQALQEEKREMEASLGAAEASVRQQQTLARGLVRLLGEAHRRLWWQRRFHDWQGWVAKRRQQRQLGRIVTHAANMTQARHFYTQWRLFALTRRECKFTLAEESRWKCRETELLAEVEALKGLVEEERRRSDGLEEKMKTAFVRGVCALNREAVQVLRGTQGAAAEEEEEQQQQQRQGALEVGGGATCATVRRSYCAVAASTREPHA